MPIISVRIIKNPRIQRYCEECSRRIDGETIRLYGMADYGDKPYPLYLHRKCIKSKDALGKIRDAEQRVHRSDGGGTSEPANNLEADANETGEIEHADNAPHSVSR